MSKLKLFISSLMIASLFVGCTEDEKIDITDISFDGDTLTVTEGLTYDASDAITVTGGDADQANITFTSGDANIVSVDGSTLTAEAVGSTTLTATETNSDLTATVNVNVIAKLVAVTGITLDTETEDLKVGETLQLAATIAPADATEQGVIWSVAFPSGSKTKEDAPTDIATVSDAGMVTAVAAGEVVVTAKSKDGDFTASATISITNVAVTGIKFELEGGATSVTVIGNEVVSVTPTIEPANATIQAVTWSLEYVPVLARSQAIPTADFYASIDAETGAITGKAECDDCGLKLVVTTVDGGKEAKIPLNIDYVEITGIEFEQTDGFKITAGDTEQMIYSVIPENANNQEPDITWSIDTRDNGSCEFRRVLVAALPDYSDYAFVDAFGLIEAIKDYDESSCYDLAVTAQVDGIDGASASAMFHVENIKATSVTIDQGETHSIEQGQTTTLTASVLPENTTLPGITWSMYDPTAEPARVAVACYTLNSETGEFSADCIDTYTVYAYNEDSELVDSIEISVTACTTGCPE
ncbi:Ig-like domain-containing protein [Reichenbachiella sp.]|uniref:Ig-like domain-containing protein n=1 Tax=Reichenbachiella sp. TaxID=2184521 RepID=UPI003B5BCFAF